MRERLNLENLLGHLVRSSLPTPSVVERAEARANRVGKVLLADKDMSVTGYELSGSISKETAVDPVSDIDVVIYLDPYGWRSTRGVLYAPSTVLKVIEDRLSHTYTVHIRRGDVRIRRQTHSVGVIYSGAQSLDIDVVPAIWDDGSGDRLVRIPERGTGDWILTSVYRQKQALDRLDAPGRPLRRGIRALKVWRNNLEVDIHSYGLETIVMVLVAENVVRRSVESIVLGTLEWLEEIPDVRAIGCMLFDHRDDEPGRYAACAFDPAVPGNNVLSYLTHAECKRIATRARKTLRQLTDAKECLAEGDLSAALEVVEEAFGLETGLSIS